MNKKMYWNLFKVTGRLEYYLKYIETNRKYKM